MIAMLTITILASMIYTVSLSARLSRDWLTSPAVMMILFFGAVIMPGLMIEPRNDLALRALLGYNLWMFGALCGVVVSALMIRTTSGNLGVNSQMIGTYRVCIFFVLLAIPAITLTFFMLGRIPLLIGIQSALGAVSDLSMHQARQMNTLEHRSGDTVYFGQGYLRQIYTVVSPVFLIAASAIAQSRGWRGASRFLFLLKILLVTAAAMNGQIWIAASVMLLFGMGSIVVATRINGKPIDGFKLIWRGVMAYIGLLVFIFGYRYFQFLQGRHFENFFQDTFARIYIPGAIDLFQIFPDYEAFRWGSTWLNDLSGMLPGSVQSFAYEVHYLVHGGGWGFTLSPGIVPSAYANFGFAGIFLTALVFTTVFNMIYLRAVASPSAVRMAAGIYLSQMFTMAMPGDIASYVVPLITALIIVCTYVICNSLYRQILIR